MSIINYPGADEKNAKVSLRLRADSGFNSSLDGERISANQWAALVSICEETATGKVLMAAPELLDAVKDAADFLVSVFAQIGNPDTPEGWSDPDSYGTYQVLIAALAKAGDPA